jgi:hypothetical protein
MIFIFNFLTIFFLLIWEKFRINILFFETTGLFYWKMLSAPTGRAEQLIYQRRAQ